MTEAGVGGDRPVLSTVPLARPAWTAPEGASRAGSGPSALAGLQREGLAAPIT